MFNPECVTCRWLGSCSVTDAEKVLSHFVCANYAEVQSAGIVQARCDIINKYQKSGLEALIYPPHKKKEA